MRRLLGFLVCGLVVVALPLGTAARAKADEGTEARDISKLVEPTRTVVAAIVEAAKKNRQLPLATDPGAKAPFRREKDELTAYYFHEAALAAKKLPPEKAGPAYLLALGIALDDSDLIRDNLVTRGFWRKVESNEERKARIAVLGEPMIQGRHDLCQHFSVSAALTVLLGSKGAESAGIVKEMLDARDPNNGFSFNDLSADIAGVAFASKLLKEPKMLDRVAESFKVADYTIKPMYEPEGLPAKEFAKMFGGVSDERFLDKKKEIWKKVLDQPGFAVPKKEEKP
jgi:hypothetical protein